MQFIRLTRCESDTARARFVLIPLDRIDDISGGTGHHTIVTCNGQQIIVNESLEAVMRALTIIIV